MKLRWFVFPAFIAGVLLFVKPTYADEYILTKEKIKDFHEKSVDVQMDGAKATIAFYKKHTHTESKTVIHVITNMAGAPQQKQTLTLNKRELLRETQKGYDMAVLESIENNILSLKIDTDGRSAKVKDSTYSISVMSMNPGQGIVKFRVEQSMLCDNVIVLSEDNIIQVKESLCNAEANIASIK